ncbi:aldehyde dehydrogenase (NADP(+)) [Aeromicrobium camelliae]|uniref:Aldehyde dehydrogenase (NADP(+)) n=1 Tax=Aeromicrobium camelliae TaxID=1538144 RepID=A0A3N6X4W5_9ACTN|nr:aldehyde dehydrogenase (NADP(+)) [Aeromicrobium camelliae]RQN08703.1 aldehyde dehydrogenase (NADP(+)) [Aeromicrobium camelliae]
MTDLGHHLIGGELVGPGDGPTFQAVDPATGGALEPAFGEGDAALIDRAARLAWEAFASYRTTSPEDRARFLESIATGIEDAAQDIADQVTRETGLPAARVAGETARTAGQLRLFAAVLRDGTWQHLVMEPALPDRAPLPRPDLRQRPVPLGPVAVFGASNFPLAFSVAGGDTASALAAGAPVVVKAHPAHPGTSELVGRVVARAVHDHGLHPGTFSLIHGTTHEVGTALVQHPAIRAVGFTGSRTGGLALADAAADRPVPIPVFAEMSSINPVFVLPGALAADPEGLAAGLVTSVTGSGGQLCTKPGLVFVPRSAATDAFLTAAAEQIRAVAPSIMLTRGIRDAFEGISDSIAGIDGVDELDRGTADDGPTTSTARVFVTDLATFDADPQLQQEMFGPATLLVLVDDPAQLRVVPERLEGQLTATLHLTAEDHELARPLLSELELLVGRVIVNGWPTGVDVGHAMVHGGPYPATSAPATTSVGARAIERFVRPVVYQNVPTELLAPELQDTTSKETAS